MSKVTYILHLPISFQYSAVPWYQRSQRYLKIRIWSLEALLFCLLGSGAGNSDAHYLLESLGNQPDIDTHLSYPYPLPPAMRQRLND